MPTPSDLRNCPVIIAALIRLGIDPMGATWSQLPGGHTNRTWRIVDSQHDIVLKSHEPSLENPLFPYDSHAEACVLGHLEPFDLAPRLRTQMSLGAQRVVILDYVVGTSWTKGADAVAHALHRIHKLPGPFELRRAADGSEEIASQTLAILEQCEGDQAKGLRRSAPLGYVPPSGRLALLHGDPVPGNVIVDPSGASRLIDWQCPARGDPSADVALFLSPAMQLSYRGEPLNAQEHKEFLAAYPDPETTARYLRLAPWYHWRMAAYCLWVQTHLGRPMQDALALEMASGGLNGAGMARPVRQYRRNCS